MGISEKSFADRRISYRRQARMDALAVPADTDAPIDCVIEDMNGYGARITCKGVSLPDSFFLLDMLAHAAYAARVVWRDASRLGLQFDRSFYPSIDACPGHVQKAYRERLARDRESRTRPPSA